MQINTYHDCIYEVENFLTDEQLQPLLDAIATAPDKAWFREDYPDYWNGKNFNPQGNGYEEADATLHEIQEHLETLFSNATSFVQISDIHRFRAGDTLSAHRDNVNQDFANQFGVVIYLNGEFEGGELDYPELGFRLKPKVNSLLIHRAELLHQVLEVTEGVRYTLTTFIAGDETTAFKPANQKD